MSFKVIKDKVMACLLAVTTLLSAGIIPAQATSISDGKSTTVTVVMGNRNTYLTTLEGNTLGGEDWTYTTNDGISGAAYCINWGLSAVNPNKPLTIGGIFTSNPKTIGAFAGGYPQRSLSDFLTINSNVPELAGLTVDEFAYATQVAVWSTLGQLAVQGTDFTTGRATLGIPAYDTQKTRIYTAIKIILDNASYWDRPLKTGMQIRFADNNANDTVDIQHKDGIAGVVGTGAYGIKLESRNGQDYYTREFIASSFTSTWKNGYYIDVWAESATNGIFFTDIYNGDLDRTGDGAYRVPVTQQDTFLNDNGSEYSGKAKIWIPVKNAEPNGDIKIRGTSTITQYNIYLANNTEQTEQSYVIADPLYAPMGCMGTIKWSTLESVYGRLLVNKVDGMGLPLQGAMFELEGADGKNFSGTSDKDGKIEWDMLNPNVQYVLKEIKAPDGYLIADAVNVSVPAGQTSIVTVINQSIRNFRIKKVDAQNGVPLIGATFRFEKIDGSYTTEVTTGHDGVIEFAGGALPYGAYRVYEVQAPAGYEKDSTVQTANWDGKSDVYLTFKNVRTPSFTLIKIDEATNDSLADAVFNVYKDGSLITSVKTDNAGYAYVRGLSTGYYEVEETTAPKGYVLDSTKHGIYINPYNPAMEDDPILIVSNKAKPGLRIVKYDAVTMKPLDRTVFEVYRDATLIGTYTTDSKGEILLKDLTPGTYLVKEISIQGSFIVNSTPQQIELKAGITEIPTLVFLNQQKPGISLVKLDSETMRPLAGARYLIEKVGGSFSMEFTTGSNGEINLTDLDPGAYTVKEISAPVGYVIDDGIRTIQINANENATFVFTNTKKPTLRITKVDATTNEVLKGATFRIVKVGDGTNYFDRTTDNNGIIEISDLDVGIYSAQEIVAPNGYELNDMVYYVELFAGKTSQLIVGNKLRPSLQIIKYDTQTMTAIPDTTFEVYRNARLMGTYVTDRNGEVLLSKVETGTYLVKEIATTSGYVVNSTPQQVELTAGNTETVRLVFLNQQKPGIYLIKVDSDTMLPLVNAKFLIEKLGGSFVKEYLTNVNGEINLTELEPGAYTVKEITAPSGYLIDEAVRTIQINPDENAEFVFTNTKKPSIEVLKYDPVRNKYLPGTTFRIAKIEDGSNYLDRVTDIDGRIFIDNLDVGIYSVKEIAAPSGYVLNDTEYHVELFGGKNSQLVVINELKPSLQIIKTDALTGKPIEGVVFTIKKADGETITSLATNNNGEILIDNLDPAVYEITETSVPNGYLLDPIPQYITLVPNRTGTVHFKNFHKPTLTINKIDSVTGDAIKGAKFSVVYASNNTFTGEINDLGTYFTDEKGQIILADVFDGWYKITELEPATGYAIKDPAMQEVYVRAWENKSVTFQNTPLSALVIKKVDADTGEVLQGAKFRLRYLYGVSGTGGTTIGEYTTSAQGTIIVTDLKAGTYIVEEIKAPDGYAINDAPETVYISGREQDVITVEFANSKDGGLIVRKLDSTNNQPLANARFKITKADGSVVGNSNGEFVTDNAGYIHIPNLLTDSYVVEEVTAPDGYVIDRTPQTIKVESGKTHMLTFYNHPDSGLIIKKVDSTNNQPLATARFKITKADGSVVGNSNGEYVTNYNGIIHIPNIDTDTYIVEEIAAPSGYVVDNTPQTVQLQHGETHMLTFYNHPDSGLIIKKVDSTNNQPLVNARFKVTKADGSVVGTSNGEYITNENGIIHIPNIDTDTYVIEEIAAPSGYVVDNTPQTVKLEHGKTHMLTFYNHPDSGLIIKKVDSTNSQPLVNARFKITKADGSVVGTSNGEYVTNENGIIHIPNIDTDTYVIEEIAAPQGYIVDNTPQTVKLEHGKTHMLTFYNHPDSGLIIKKVDSTNNQPLANARFKITKADGSVVGTSNGEYITNENGAIHIPNIDTDTYIVEEIAAPQGYVVDNTPQTVQLQHGKTHMLTFYNHPDSGLIIKKVDSTNNQPLINARFLITNDKGVVIGNENGEYVTNSNGLIHITNLPTDTYIVKEIEPPSGYVVDNTPQTIKLEHGQTHMLTFYNHPDSGLIIKKVDSTNNQPLVNARFKVTKADGSVVGNSNGEYLTNENGVIHIPNIDTDTYVIEEIAAPSGYVVDNTPQTVQLQHGETHMLTFYNHPDSGLIIKKVDSTNNQPLANARFKITKTDGSVVGTSNGEYVTNENGIIHIPNIDTDTYVVEEIAAPSGYVVDNTPQTVKLEHGKTHMLTFYNHPDSGLIIKKVDSTNSQPLANARFKITKADGSVVGTSNGEYVTNENGVIHIPNIDTDTYVVEEIVAPQGYVVDNTPQTVKLEHGKTHMLTFYNHPDSGLIIKKVDSTNSQPLANARFKITKADGSVVGTSNGEYITNENGIIHIPNIDTDTYVIEEIAAPSGYVVDNTPQTVKLEHGKTHMLTFYNHPDSGLIIKKVDSSNNLPLANARFKITKADGSVVGNENGEYITNENGVIHIPNIDTDTYVIEEIAAPQGYVVDNTPQTVKLEHGKTHMLTFYNHPDSGLIIKKLDAINNQPLANARFKVTNDKGIVIGNGNGEYITNANGIIHIPNIDTDTYVVEEIAAPSGYVVDNTPQTVKLEHGQTHTLTFYNYPDSGLVIKKLDSINGKPLSNARFKVTNDKGIVVGNENGEYVTNANGLIHIPNMPTATYIVQEIAAPSGYVVDNTPQTVKLEHGQTHTLTFYNKPNSGLIIKKLDSATNKPLSGAVFRVTNSAGVLVGSGNGEYVTDNGGFIHLPDLPTDTYVVQELKAPSGYVLENTPQTVKLIHGQTHTLTFYNNPNGGLVITKLDSKTGEPLSGAVFKVTNSMGTVVGNGNGRYTTNRSGTIHIYGLPSDTYIVTEISAPDGYILDGTPQTIKVIYGETHSLTFYNTPQGGLRITKLDEETRQPIRNVEFEITKMNGEKIGNYRTNSNGVINLNDIDNGWYTIVEKKAASGYQLDSEPHNVEVKNGKIADITITNRKASSFLIHKIDSITGKGIYGVTFLLYDANRNPIGQYTSDQNGYVYIDKTLTDGKYFIRELEAAPGYVLDTEVKTFYVEYGSTSEITWKNTPVRGQIQIVKKSADANPINGFPAGTLLSGATFEIYDKAGNLVDTVITDKNGFAASKALPLGCYTVKETVAPDFYSLNSNTVAAELEFAGQIVRLEVLNNSVYANVSVQKRGYTEVVPGQSIRYDFKNIANNSTVSLDSFYWRDTLPTDAVRLDKIITGTWNARLSYKVVFKTNVNGDYRTLADNLQTSKNYTLDASPAALGLASNEFVTEFMFVFGNVPAGFSQVEAPYIYCKVLDWLPHEYRFTNKTDVGGLWGNQWIMANDRFVTVVYNKQTPAKLPRTGY